MCHLYVEIEFCGSSLLGLLAKIILLDGLRKSGCTDWIVTIIIELYRDCSTTPVSMQKKQLSNPISIASGVKQGCPMSSTLFNFYVNPILAMVHRLGATCLGYMNDLAVIIPKHLDVQSIVNEVTRVAGALRMSFNIKKCGIINQDKPTTLKEELIPEVTARCSYQYLGANAATKKLEGLMESFSRFQDDCKIVLDSELTPMQKLHSLRTHLLPKLHHLIQNSSPLQSELRKINSYLQKITKQICFLPTKAANSYIHLNRIYGGQQYISQQ